MSIDQESLQDELILPHEFHVRLKEVEYCWECEDLKLSGRFFYLAFRDGRPTIEEFVEFIFYRITEFCLTGKELKKIQNLAREGDHAAHARAVDKARNLFIQTARAHKKGGEPGELILYLLLEIALQAPQLVAKMPLKTNANMPVHGADGIHVRFDNDSNSLQVFWGESKLYKDFSEATNDAVKSVAGFHSNNHGGRARELEIIREHTSMSNDALTEELLRYFDPYESKSNNVREYNACFIGFDFLPLSQLSDVPADQVEEMFKQKYLDRIISGCGLIEKKVKKYKAESQRFLFFLLPFESIDRLREVFFKKLGLSTDD